MAVMKRRQSDTIGQKYSADTVDAKSCKARKNEATITDEEGRSRQSDTTYKCKRYVGIPGRK